MDDAAEEKLRLDARHNDELVRIGQTQEQQRKDLVKTQLQERKHIALVHTQERAHRRFLLDLVHNSIHEAAVARQKALNDGAYEHRKRMLELERPSRSPEAAAEPGQRVAGSEDAASSNTHDGDKGVSHGLAFDWRLQWFTRRGGRGYGWGF